MNPDELLERMAVTFRSRIGPEVGDTFARTQAFMASVILEKLSRQLRAADAHAAAERAERAVLRVDLDALLDADTPAELRRAVNALTEAVARAGPAPADRPDLGAMLGHLVATRYDQRAVLGEPRFEVLLGRVRTTLRARIDRQMEYAA